MSSSPRLIVLFVSAFVFLGAFTSRTHAAELTLLQNFQLEGLTFYNPLTFSSPAISQTVNIAFEMTPTFTIQDVPGEQITLEAVVTPPDPDMHVLAITTSSPTSTAEATPTPTTKPTTTPTLTMPPLTATPTPPPPVVAPVDLESLFSRFSDEYHVDKELLKRIANCESSFNSGASYMDYGGMFQFSSSSWSTTRNQMGQDQNPELRYNAEESIKTAAFKISRDGSSAWPSCNS